MQYTRTMRKPKTRQANWRLPEPLLRDLRDLAQKTDTPLTDIVRSGLQERVNRLKSRLAKEQREKEAALSV